MTQSMKCVLAAATGMVFLAVVGCEGDPAARDSQGRHISAVGGTVDGNSTELVGGAHLAVARPRSYIAPGESMASASGGSGLPTNGGNVVSNSVTGSALGGIGSADARGYGGVDANGNATAPMGQLVADDYGGYYYRSIEETGKGSTDLSRGGPAGRPGTTSGNSNPPANAGSGMTRGTGGAAAGGNGGGATGGSTRAGTVTNDQGGATGGSPHIANNGNGPQPSPAGTSRGNNGGATNAPQNGNGQNTQDPNGTAGSGGTNGNGGGTGPSNAPNSGSTSNNNTNNQNQSGNNGNSASGGASNGNSGASNSGGGASKGK